MITTGGEGKVPPRKRLRGKIGDPSNAPELKSHNLCNATGDLDNTFYNKFRVVGVFNNTATSVVNDEYQTGLWYPIKCNWPQLGTNNHQRIGKKIRVKILRLKGYVGYSPYLITQVRYRIVLYRTKKQESYTHTDFIYPMYSSARNLSAYAAGYALQNYGCENYYSSFFNKDYLKENEIKRRVLFRGIIQPQPDVPNFTLAANSLVGDFANGVTDKQVSTNTEATIMGLSSGVIGNAEVATVFNGTNLQTAPTNGMLQSTTHLTHIPFGIDVPQKNYMGQFQPHVLAGVSPGAIVPVNCRGFFPIDITVNMADNVNVEKYDYILVVESDWVIGQDPNGSFGTTPNTTNFYFSFVPHIYYTDD